MDGYTLILRLDKIMKCLHVVEQKRNSIPKTKLFCDLVLIFFSFNLR